MARTTSGNGESKTTKAPAKAPTRRRTDKARETAAAVANDSASVRASAMPAAEASGTWPSATEVERLAYQLYVQRGYNDGHDKDDWYEAERQLRDKRH